MEIEGIKLEEKHKGAKVTYIPPHADGPQDEDAEGGTISSWNDTYVFVNYGTGTNKATYPRMLVSG